jgi:uncharacterized protein
MMSDVMLPYNRSTPTMDRMQSSDGIKSLARGHFPAPPAIRLYGKAGERRAATESEAQLFRKRIRFVSQLKGSSLLWGQLRQVREIEFYKFEDVRMGKMTEQGAPG